MSELVKVIALSQGVQGNRPSYKDDYLMAQSQKAAAICGTYENAFEVALKFAELFGANIVNYETEEALKRAVEHAAEFLKSDWVVSFKKMITDAIGENNVTDDKAGVFKKLSEINEALAAEVATLQATIAEQASKIEELSKALENVQSISADAKVPSESEVTPDSNVPSDSSPAPGKVPLDLSQVPLTTLAITKALKTALVHAGCTTVADVVKLHETTTLEKAPGIGDKSQQIILDAIAKLVI